MGLGNLILLYSNMMMRESAKDYPSYLTTIWGGFVVTSGYFSVEMPTLKSGYSYSEYTIFPCIHNTSNGTTNPLVYKTAFSNNTIYCYTNIANSITVYATLLGIAYYTTAGVAF